MGKILPYEAVDISRILAVDAVHTASMDSKLFEEGYDEQRNGVPSLSRHVNSVGKVRVMLSFSATAQARPRDKP